MDERNEQPTNTPRIEGKYMGSVKVGPKGQIVIPKEVRQLFGIEPGDQLILLADIERGIAIQKYDLFEELSRRIFNAEAAARRTNP